MADELQLAANEAVRERHGLDSRRKSKVDLFIEPQASVIGSRSRPLATPEKPEEESLAEFYEDASDDDGQTLDTVTMKQVVNELEKTGPSPTVNLTPQTGNGGPAIAVANNTNVQGRQAVAAGGGGGGDDDDDDDNDDQNPPPGGQPNLPGNPGGNGNAPGNNDGNPNGNGNGNGAPNGNAGNDPLTAALDRFLGALVNRVGPHRNQAAREEKKLQKFIVPSDIPPYKGEEWDPEDPKKKILTIEDWLGRIQRTARMGNWKPVHVRYVLLAKLEDGAKTYLECLNSSHRESVRSIVKALMQRYGTSPEAEAYHLREASTSKQQLGERGTAFLERVLPHYRRVILSDRTKLTTLRGTLAFEYAEEIRRRNITKFDDALIVIADYDRALEQHGRVTRVTSKTAQINAVQFDSANAGVMDQVSKNRDEIKMINDKLDNIAKTLTEKKKSSKWCKFHKTNGHDDSECYAQKRNKNKKFNKFDNKTIKSLQTTVNAIAEQMKQINETQAKK